MKFRVTHAQIHITILAMGGQGKRDTKKPQQMDPEVHAAAP